MFLELRSYQGNDFGITDCTRGSLTFIVFGNMLFFLNGKQAPSSERRWQQRGTEYKQGKLSFRWDMIRPHIFAILLLQEAGDRGALNCCWYRFILSGYHPLCRMLYEVPPLWCHGTTALSPPSVKRVKNKVFVNQLLSWNHAQSQISANEDCLLTALHIAFKIQLDKVRKIQTCLIANLDQVPSVGVYFLLDECNVGSVAWKFSALSAKALLFSWKHPSKVSNNPIFS